MKDLILTILNILKYAGKAVTIFRNFIINTLFLILLIFIGVTLYFKEERPIAFDSALLLSISGNIVEEKKVIDPLNELFNESIGFSKLPEETLLQDILDAINSAADDDRISAIVLDMRTMGTSSFNQIKDIGEALDTFKLSGKPVIAAEDFYTQNKYLLASYADKIFLNPVGVIDLHGLGAYRLYFKDALEKLKINYHVFRVGTYKSALEPITRNSMSEDAKSQNLEWLNALWNSYTEDIVERRNIDKKTIDQYTNKISDLLNEHGGDTAQLALKINLVDELKTRQELRSYLIGLTGKSHSRGFKYVTLKEYLEQVTRSYQYNGSNGQSIGIIIAQGDILTGEQSPGNIGSDTLLRVIRKAREDKSIKAVVLRVDSGGGSVFASEIIRRELNELRNSGKPLVISMGSMAASGGYWIAAEADEIWAYPTTLTGSIGIFGAIPTFENSLAHIGVYSDGIGTTNLSAGMNISQPLNPEIKNAIQIGIEHGYEQFLDIVSEGRDIQAENLQRIAEGRVFDGITAQDLGLVDKIGNLANAIESAAELANLQNYSARYIRSSASFSEKLMQRLQNTLNSFALKVNIPDYLLAKIQFLKQSVTSITLFNDPKGLYAHCMIHYF